MRVDSSRWEEINPSAHAHEQDGLRELASYLPDVDPFHVWANVEFVGTDGSINEVDALVLTPGGLFIVELKHWQGELSGDGIQWVRRPPHGRLTPEDNPYILANRKAKRLAGLIRHYARRQGRERDAPFIGAAVFLHAREFRSRLDQIGRQHVYGLDGVDSGLPSLKDFLLSRPTNRTRVVDPRRGAEIVELVKGAKIRPSVANRRLGQLILHARPLAEGVGWQDYLAGHQLDQNVIRRVRFYLASRAASDDVPAIKRAAEREFRLLQGVRHPGITHAVDLVEHPWGPAVVFDHASGALRFDQWLTQIERKLKLAQKLQIVQELAEILDYAHSRRLSHRSLHPRAIWVARPESARRSFTIADWQAGGRLPGATEVSQLSSGSDTASLELFFDDYARRYQAPEGIHASAPGLNLDVFALGALAYRIFGGVEPASTAEELVSAVRNRGLNLAAVVDGLPESLVELVFNATHGDPAQRLPSVTAFRRGLDAVWEELTGPEPEPERIVDPLEARKDDVLDGGLRVIRRLGTGATATALLVREAGGGDGAEGRQLVLKVARDEQYADRLAAEAQVLAKLTDEWQVASIVREPLMVGTRTALLMESAGSYTLAQDLQQGRLALGLLERYGLDLLDIVALLERRGIWHRDLKPANLAARPRSRDKQVHLCVFDFSLAATPVTQLGAGTVPYLDPFLGPPSRTRYDAAAERFAAAVTLYEMATGALPRWGEHANPAAIEDEVTLDPSLFDQAVADRLVTFFARALARDASRRFDTIEEMTQAWRQIFVAIPVVPPTATVPAAPELTLTSPLEATSLTPRARSALERLGVHTVGELLAKEPSELTRARGVPDATRKEILAQQRALRALLSQELAAPADATLLAEGVEAVRDTLLDGIRPGKELAAIEVAFGFAATADGVFLSWPSQKVAAEATGQSQPQLSIWLRKHAQRWLANPALAQVRDELVAVLDTRGGVMSAQELAEALIASRGSFTNEPARLPQAIGLVRAAIEVELARGGDSRVAIRRLRSADTVLVGLEPDDLAAVTGAADALDHAAALGQRATILSTMDPLASRQAAIDELRRVRSAAKVVLDDHRLLQLAMAASGGEAALSPQGQLYPAGMAADRALRLAASALAGQRFTEEALRARVQARFPAAKPLPGRPELGRMLDENNIALVWDQNQHVYAPRTWQQSKTATRLHGTASPLVGAAELSDVDTKLAAAIQGRGYLAVLAPLRYLARARRALLARQWQVPASLAGQAAPGLSARVRLTEVDVTAILLARLRDLGHPWEVIVAADTGGAGHADFDVLVQLVQHDVLPAITEALATDQPVLITEAAPLARYGQLRLLAELADATRPRPAARLLLLPARRPDPVLLDGEQVPLTSRAAQSLWLPDAWIAPSLEPKP
jgi:serine/threonine protein kinase